MKKDIILASQSARRRELLAKAGATFTCEPANLTETIDTSLSHEEAIQKLAYQKAAAILAHHPEALVIGSDTVVVCQGEILGKPRDHEDCVRMLRMLSGRTHEVITGLCFLSRRRCHQEVSVAEVTFAELSEDEILAYAATSEPYDKAGAYAIQGRAACFITGIRGDYYTIMGLPLERVYQELKNISLY